VSALAGTFWHLSLAQQAFPIVSQAWPTDDRKILQRAFLAGSIAPDLGFFPGGPKAFSDRVHHEATGDYLRSLYADARDSLERAFVCGWALHVYTDVATHPWINEFADRTLAGLDGHLAKSRDLWHLRLENGIDCHFLAQPDQGFLWQVNLDWGSEKGAALLANVGSRYFGGIAGEADLGRGLNSQGKWVARLPHIFLLTGHTDPDGRSVRTTVGRWMRPLVSTAIGDWLGGYTGWTNVGAVGNPLKSTPQVVERVSTLSSAVLEAFGRSANEQFSSLANLDLDTGKVLVNA
jgi:hypothetical protein